MKTAEADSTLDLLCRSVATMLDELPIESVFTIRDFRAMVLPLAEPCELVDPVLEVRAKRLLLSILRTLNDNPHLSYERLLQVIDREIPFHGVSLFQHIIDGSKLAVVYRNGPVVDLLDRFEFGNGMGFSAWVAGHGAQVLLTNIHPNPEHSKSYVRSFISIALPHGDRIVGVLNLSHTVRDAFDASDLQLLSTIAPPLGAILTRIHSHRALSGTLRPDDLTGLLSERGIVRRIREEFHHARRHDGTLSVGVLELFELDAIREEVGVPEAERALAEAGRVIRRHLGEANGAGRRRNNEFILVLPGIPPEATREIVQRCAHAIARISVDRGPGLRASGGTAELRRDDESPVALIERATDAARMARIHALVVSV
ncbi:MAG: hypothetical protein CME06_05795 [Gemmatimonadetes bacterium]|nr:hypothetical protein [Gemmatimonadota bacterium]